MSNMITHTLTHTHTTTLPQGNFSGAELLYQQCVDYNPCDGRAWLGLARIYWKRGQALRFVHVCAHRVYVCVECVGVCVCMCVCE